ncbi:MAG: right-handed parallel beta-helix repeat-containing protein [Sedimentisphaerales bacterium]|nr:right-handed parallel beta-helix repeat-containing protein [Sedimentisphaerales bacterium]
MKNVAVASLILSIVMSASLQAALLKVPSEYPSIQEAIDASSDGDTVRVAPGLYFERIDFKGENIIVTSEDPNDARTVGYTILNAEGEGSVVTFQSSETSRAVLTGFTLTGGMGTLRSAGETYKYYYGAGIYCMNASPTITRNVIAGNAGPYLSEETTIDLGAGRRAITYRYEYSYGGGIYCAGGATITNNLIYRNTAYAGGGIYYNGYGRVANNIIHDNSGVYGGGVYIYGGRLAGNTIVDNDASVVPDSGRGGNVYASFGYDPDSLVVVNNIICGAKSGGGFYWLEASGDAIRFNNVWGNLPSDYVTLDPRTSEIVYDGAADWTNRHGNACEDPLLLTAWNERYHLSPDSPCVSAGDPNGVPASGETDIDGDPRIYAVRVDIGADERVGYVRPLAQAGADLHVLTPEPVTLDGTGSYFSDPAGSTTFQWTQSEGTAVQIDDPTAAMPTFTPPAEGWYRFELVVGDDQFASAPDEVLVVVGNERPVADAGPDRLWPASGTVVLDASGSHDADPPDELTYAWTQIDGPPVNLTDPNSATASFQCQAEGIYRFQVVTNDGFADSAPDEVKIEAAPFTTHVEPFTLAEEGTRECYYGSVSGTMVAYAGLDFSDLTMDICCRDIKTGEVVTFDAGLTDTMPRIDGGTVVWTSGLDYFFSMMCTSVCATDLATGQVRRLCRARADESYGYPAISGNTIVCLRHRNVVTADSQFFHESTYDICGVDVSDWSAPVQFTIAEQVGHGSPYPSDDYYYADDDYVDISGSIVVWEGDGDIYGADISDLNDIRIFPICMAAQRQSDPAVSGNLVVWMDERNDLGDIYGADISDREHIREFEVCVQRGWQLRPDVDGALIAFSDGDDYSGYIRTYCYSPQYGPTPYALSGSRYGAAPRIDGATIAWCGGGYQVLGARVEFGYASADGSIRNVTTGRTYDYIQHAIFGAVDGDVILVPEGTHREKLRLSGRNVTLTSVDPTDPTVRAATVLTGGGQLVTFAEGETPDCLLTGLTLTGGSYGIYCSGSAPTIRLCNVTGNRDAGFKLWGASRPTIDRCDITDNGIGLEMWALAVTRVIPHNYPTLTNCLIARNRAEGIFGSNPTVENCTIAHNLGMGVSGVRPTIRNSIVYFNNGHGTDVEGKLQLTVTYSDIEGGAPGQGNIDTDPLFKAPGNYHLKSEGWSWDALAGQWTWDDVTSPCIDAADPGASLGEEIRCEPGDPFSERAVNHRLNMGAYGGTVEASLAPR